ncbi:MAG: TPM domain-containing protein [Hyphomicrobiales bacterium]
MTGVPLPGRPENFEPRPAPSPGRPDVSPTIVPSPRRGEGQGEGAFPTTEATPSRPAPGQAIRYLTAALLAALLLALALPGTVRAEPTFPELTGRVVDNADLLPADVEADLTARLAALEEKSSDQLVVVTLPSLGVSTIEDYGYKLGRHWGIGQKDKNNGVLLIIAPNERKVRIEVGYGLEGVLPDAVSKLIIETSILPRFKSGDMAGGIVRGVEDIISVLTGDSAEWQQRALQRSESDDPEIIVFIVFFIIVTVFIIIMIAAASSSAASAGKGGSRRSSSSGWSSGSSGWSGGGGFSGGGGSFGGGGSSGSW